LGFVFLKWQTTVIKPAVGFPSGLPDAFSFPLSLLQQNFRDVRSMQLFASTLRISIVYIFLNEVSSASLLFTFVSCKVVYFVPKNNLQPAIYWSLSISLKCRFRLNLIFNMNIVLLCCHARMSKLLSEKSVWWFWFLLENRYQFSYRW